MAVCEQGMDAIRTYFLLLKKKAETLKRLKIILLGEACSGKTSLILTMVNRKSTCTEEEDRTIGVDEYELKLSGGRKAKALDCGGQRCYLLTNQLFVSENAMIWIVVDINRYQMTKESFRQHIGQYLQVAYERCRQNQVAVVFTKIDCFHGKLSRGLETTLEYSAQPEFSAYGDHVSRQLEELKQSRLTKLEKMKKTGHREETIAFVKSQNIRICSDVIFASAKILKSVEKLTYLLAQDQNMFPTVDNVIPSAWIDFEGELVKESATTQLSILEMPNVIELGSKFGLEREHVMMVLSYYHQVGTLLYFSRHPRLSKIVFGSSKELIDVLKRVFCHNHDQRPYKEEYAIFYNSSNQFYADRRQLVDNGTLTIALFKTLLNNLGLRPESLTIILNMLLCFDFAYVKGEWAEEDEPSLNAQSVLSRLEETNACLLLPWLLDDTCPDIAISQFPAECPRLWIEVDVVFSFALSLPMGIFQQFSARCHRHSHLIHHWSSGFFFTYGPVSAEFTCESEGDSPGIQCRCRTPKSMNALLRLFHVLWRCIVDLAKLLQTVPGCLYEIFLNFHDGEETLTNHDIKIGITAEGTLERYDVLNDDVISRDCSKAVDEVNASIFHKQTLKTAFSNDLGKLVLSSSWLIKDVAKVVGEMQDKARHCADLAGALDIDWESSTGDVRAMLKAWVTERGDSALVAVLSDALEYCGLNEVRTKCLGDIRDVEKVDKTLQIQDAGKSKELISFPSKLSFAANHILLQMAVAKVGSGQWKSIPLFLGLKPFELDDVPRSHDESKSEKLQYMIEKWCKKLGKEATVERLLNACECADISLYDIQQEYSRTYKLSN